MVGGFVVDPAVHRRLRLAGGGLDRAGEQRRVRQLVGREDPVLSVDLADVDDAVAAVVVDVLGRGAPQRERGQHGGDDEFYNRFHLCGLF